MTRMQPGENLSINVNIFLNALFIIYTIFYLAETPIVATILYYFFEIHYTMDTTLSVLHMKWEKIRKSRYHEARHIGIIVYNMATLIPYYEMYYLLLPRADTPARDLVRLKCIFRFAILYVNLFSVNHKKVNTFADLLMKLVVFLMSISLMTATVWYRLYWESYRYTKAETEVKNKEFTSLLPEDSMGWFLIAYVKTLNTFLQNLSVGIYGREKHEIYIVIIILILGFNIIYITFIANLITNYIHHRPKFYVYIRKISNTQKMMMDLKVDANTQRQVMDYCEQFWFLRQGTLGMPFLFSVLPISSQKDITLDIFWELFRHSQLFRDKEISFKRMLSVYVKNEFILPGTCLYKKGQKQNKLYYIVSGNIQVLSNEHTPVINLTSGTILGEINILIPNVSLVSVRSTDTCVLHTLELMDFYRNMINNNKYNGKYFCDQLKSRIAYAKTAEAVRKRKLKSYETLGDKYTTPIKRLKMLWNTIVAMEDGKSTYDFFRYNWGFCSKYLDMLVINENLYKSLDRGIIFNNECPFVFRPNSNFRKMIYGASIIATILNSILLPYCAVFIRRIPKAVYDFCVIFDIFCWLELYIDLFTAINLPNIQITKPSEIVLYRMKSLTFFFDFLSCAPIDYFEYVTNTDSHNVALIKLNRVIRIYRLYYVLSLWDESTSGPRLYVKKLIKYFVLYIYFIYFLACLIYAVACPTNCLWNSWFIKKYGKKFEASALERLFSSFNLILSLVMRCHFVYTIAHNVLDNLTFLCATFVGYVLYAFCITECASYNLQNSLTNNIYLQRFRNFREILHSSKINPFFIQQVVRNIEWNWQNQALISQLENCVELPNNLKDAIEIHRLVKLLRDIEVFKMFPVEILQGIARIATIKALPPNMVIVSKGQFINTLHIIERGLCVSYYERQSKDYINAHILGPGSAFPVIASFQQQLSFITVCSITTVIIVNIPMDSLYLYLEIYNMAKIFAFCKHMSFTDLIQCDAMENVIYKKQHKDFLRERGAREREHASQIYEQKFADLGRFKFLKHLMLKETFFPEARFIKFWERIRCICAILQLFINLLALSVLFKYSHIIFILNICLDLSAFADLYVRLHVQYYNEMGILIVHPICTAKHYLSTSFITDLIGVFPAYYLNISKIFVSVNSWRNYHIYILSTRTFQLYRVFGAVDYYICVLKSGQLVAMRNVKIFLTYLTIGVLFINIFLISACDYNDSTFMMDCSKHVVFRNIDAAVGQPFVIWTIITYIYTTFFTGTSTGYMNVVDFYDTIGFYVIICLLFTLRVYIMVLFLTTMMSDSFETIINRNTIKTFVEYSKKENVMDTVIFTKMLEDFNFRWNKTRGIYFIQEVGTINKYMRYKLLDTLFGRTVLNVSLFEGISYSLVGSILGHINMEHYNKGSIIINCNDVQNRFYIVYKGSVQISLLGDINLQVLHPSGAFGSIANNGYTRQTINVQAQVHCQMLHINAEILNALLKNDPEISHRLKYMRFLNQEYFTTSTLVSEQNKSQTSRSSVFRNTLGSTINRKIRIRDSSVRRVADLFYLHFIPWTTLIIMFLYSQVVSRCVRLLTLFLINYCIDITFWLRAFLEMHLYYTDLESGNIIKNPDEIRKRYLTSYKFILDCIILIPFEAIILIFSTTYSLYGIIPRVLRLVHFLQYYLIHKMRLNTTLQFTIYFYFYFLVVMFFAAIFVEIVCDPSKCGVHAFNSVEEHCSVSKIFKNLHFGVLYVIQMITTTNYKDDIPVTPLTLLLNSIIHLAAPYMMVLMLFSISTVINSTNYTKMKFFGKIKEFGENLKNQNVSPALRKTSMEYLLKIWQTNKGENIPSIIENSPQFLREIYLMSVYGHHLREHFLFADTHVDFLRQLVTTLQRMIYLPDSQILQAGDNDGCMYFIHSGEISVKSSVLVATVEQVNIYVAKTGATFGENCGLFNLPHEHTYTCNTVVDLLVLQKNNWDYLLKFFPASHEVIIKRAKEYQVSGAYL